MFHQSPPPTSDAQDATYLYWPITDATTTQNFTTSTWSGNMWAFLWANRRNYGDAWNKRPNPLPSPVLTEPVTGHECGAVFTTVARANAATRCQVRHLCGLPADQVAAPWLAVGGSAADLIGEATLRANPSTYYTTEWDGTIAWAGTETYMVTVDKVLLPTPQFNAPKHQGVFLDYEVGDSRTDAETKAVILDCAADLHAAGRKLFLYSNPLNAPTQQYTRLNAATLPDIFAGIDKLGIFCWSESTEGDIPTSYANQLALLGDLEDADYDRLAIVYELGNPADQYGGVGTTLDDAAWVYAKLHEEGPHPTTLVFWRYFLPANTQRGNERINMACFGPTAVYST